MISIVACCHSAKLCAHAARDFRSQQNGAVTRMWRSCRVQPSHKEHAIGVVRCEKEGMSWQSLQWRCVDCVVHHERDVREEQKYLCVERASNNKRDCAHDLYCFLLPQCEALRTCRSGFPIATLTTKPVLEISGGKSPCCYDGGVNLPRSTAMHRSLQRPVGLKFLSARRSGRAGAVKQWTRSRHIEVHSNVDWIRSIWMHSKFSSFF